jgi:hypothetical protein
LFFAIINESSSSDDDKVAFWNCANIRPQVFKIISEVALDSIWKKRDKFYFLILENTTILIVSKYGKSSIRIGFFECKKFLS